MLVSMMERFLATISKLSATSDGSSADEEETLNAFLEAIKCIKCILNTKVSPYFVTSVQHARLL